MKPTIRFEECLKDSPVFRVSLEQSEQDIVDLETRLDKVCKLSTNMLEIGKQYNATSSAFVCGMRDLTDHFKGDELVYGALKNFLSTLHELQKFQTMLFDQTQRAVSRALGNFLKKEVRKVKDHKKHFDRISDDMDATLCKHAQASKHKPAEIEEADNLLKAQHDAFKHTSLDYVFQINMLQSNKRLELLNSMLLYMQAQYSYFHQGNELLTELQPSLKTLTSELETLAATTTAEKKEMERRHTATLVMNGSIGSCHTIPMSPIMTKEGLVTMEGYLFKRSSNAFKSWNRRWFIILKNQLVYRKRLKGGLTIVFDDIRLCSVKPLDDIDRRFCFELVCPTRSSLLQADSDCLRSAWLLAIQASIASAFKENGPDDELPLSTMSNHLSVDDSDNRSIASVESTLEDRPPKSPQSILRRLCSVSGNSSCCDCGVTEARWASINLGIVMCISCSGIHRSLGVHKSKVRSLTLDAWEPEHLMVMSELGNDIVNQIYEADVDEAIERASPGCSSSVRETWIKAKYDEKRFIKKWPTVNDENQKDVVKQFRRWSVKSRPLCQRTTSRVSFCENSDNSSVGAEMPNGETDNLLVLGTNYKDNDINHSPGDDSYVLDDDIFDDVPALSASQALNTLHPDHVLYRAAGVRNLSAMSEALAHEANCNWVNSDESKMTPLHQAAIGGSMSACELLLLNGAKIDTPDAKGQTALHLATKHSHTGLVCLLLKRRANQHATDNNAQDPLAIAVENQNADIVTLLRLARLNEEIKDSDLGSVGDTTFNDVFRDFSNLASNDPEKLLRRSSESRM